MDGRSFVSSVSGYLGGFEIQWFRVSPQIFPPIFPDTFHTITVPKEFHYQSSDWDHLQSQSVLKFSTWTRKVHFPETKFALSGKGCLPMQEMLGDMGFSPLGPGRSWERRDNLCNWESHEPREPGLGCYGPQVSKSELQWTFLKIWNRTQRKPYTKKKTHETIPGFMITEQI